MQVYECYLRARHDLWKYTEESLTRAEQNFKNGLSLLGEHELLYTGLGQVYFQFYDSGIRYEEEYLNKVKDCINKIFSFNPDSASGYRLSGLLKLKIKNSHEAFRDLQRAYMLNPSEPETILWLCYILSVHLGRISLAAPVLKRLLEIDPLTPFNQGIMAWVNLLGGHFGNAVKYMKEAYDMDTDNPLIAWYVGLFMGMNKEYTEAFNFIDDVNKKNPENLFSKFSLLIKYSLQKEKGKVGKLLTKDIEQIAWNDFHLPWFFAECYALIEEKEESLRWLERAVEWGMINYPFLSEIDPFLKNIRGEERFKKLMERVKYEWENFEV